MTLKPAVFDHDPRTRLIVGPDSVDQVGRLARALGGRNVLLVTDPHIEQVGHAERVRQFLESEDSHVVTFDQVVENPTTEEVDRCAEVAHSANVDLIVGVGGGSSLDTAKGCNFIYTNGGRMSDYWGVGKATKPMLPFIAIPTTAGTGSECQSFSLIADPVTHQKMACGDPKAAARVAVLDPTLTLTQPRPVAAVTGIDAIAHAVETAVTTKRNAWSLLFSREAFCLSSLNLKRVLEEGNDLYARGAMQLGAAYSGIAIENSMLGAAHSAANPLTARFGVVHGQAVGIMLPHVMRHNCKDAATEQAYVRLAQLAGLAPPEATAQYAVDAIIMHLKELLYMAQIPDHLEAFGIESSDVDALAVEASEQWTAQFNPRSVSVKEFTAFYRAALSAD